MKNLNITILLFIFIFSLFQIKNNIYINRILSYIAIFIGSVYFVFTYLTRKDDLDLFFISITVVLTLVCVYYAFKDNRN